MTPEEIRSLGGSDADARYAAGIAELTAARERRANEPPSQALVDALEEHNRIRAAQRLANDAKLREVYPRPFVPWPQGLIDLVNDAREVLGEREAIQSAGDQDRLDVRIFRRGER
jgi:hypothetical protein